MLLWISNMGYAAQPSGQPIVTTPQPWDYLFRRPLISVM